MIQRLKLTLYWGLIYSSVILVLPITINILIWIVTGKNYWIELINTTLDLDEQVCNNN